MLLVAIISFVVVLLKGLLLRGLSIVGAPIRWIAPRVWLRIKLQAARSPEEVLVIVRQWLGRPALTPEDVERVKTPEALEVAQAMRELEAARYEGEYMRRSNQWQVESEGQSTAPQASTDNRKGTSEAQWRNSLKVLLRHMGRLKHFFVLFLCLMGGTLFAAPSNYQWQEAGVITTRCATVDDFKVATNRWLGFIHDGDWSRETLLNAASTSFFAAEPELSKQILGHYDELYGRDASSQQMHAAIAAYQGHTPEAQWRVASYGGRLDTAVVVLALLIFSFALRFKAKGVRRVLRVLRVLLCVVLFVVGMSLFETHRWRASNPLPQTLPTSSASAEGGAQ
jgi:hypothetical protein